MLTKTIKPKDTITKLLHKKLTVPTQTRDARVMHASDVTKEDFCPRRLALMADGNIREDLTLLTCENVTFSIGRFIEEKIQNILHDEILGDWECQNCFTEHKFLNKPHKCKNCGSNNFKHHEVRFVSKVSGISCGIDCLLKGNSLKARIVEIKTISQDKFKTLKMPLAEHKLRTNLYMQCVEESDSPYKDMVNTSVATIIYVTKGGWGCPNPKLRAWGIDETFSPFKEFTVKRDDKLTTGIINKALEYYNYRQGKTTTALGNGPI